jgi:hypothetical protein
MSAEQSHEPMKENWIRGVVGKRQLTTKLIYIKRTERRRVSCSLYPRLERTR